MGGFSPTHFEKKCAVRQKLDHLFPPRFGKQKNNWATKKPLLLSIESWLVNRDPYIGLWNNPLYNWVEFHPLYNPNQPGGPFFMAQLNCHRPKTFSWWLLKSHLPERWTPWLSHLFISRRCRCNGHVLTVQIREVVAGWTFATQQKLASNGYLAAHVVIGFKTCEKVG